jgi:VanZ family protein
MGQDSSRGRVPGRKRSRRRWVWAAAGVYAAFVAYMSLRPFGNSEVERVIDGVGRAYFHLPAYAGLATLLALALSRRRSSACRAAAAFAAATAYGWLLEIAQIPAPTRSFNVQGLLFDAAGAAAGSAAALCLLLLTDRVRRKRTA